MRKKGLEGAVSAKITTLCTEFGNEGGELRFSHPCPGMRGRMIGIVGGTGSKHTAVAWEHHQHKVEVVSTPFLAIAFYPRFQGFVILPDSGDSVKPGRVGHSGNIARVSFSLVPDHATTGVRNQWFDHRIVDDV